MKCGLPALAATLALAVPPSLAFVLGIVAPLLALPQGYLLKEEQGESDVSLGPCPLAPNRNGTCANYRWYNVCSGYIWIYPLAHLEAVGAQFGGPQQPCVAPGNKVKRVITYWRNVNPNYYATVNVYLDRDDNGDGCPDGVIASDLYMDPGLRWNCSNFNVTIPAGLSHVIVRQMNYCPAGYYGCDHPRLDNSAATDGPFTSICDPAGVPRSFYYGVNGSACIPWVGPTGRADNFLTWLIVDSGPTSVEGASWGQIKSLYR
jgi:hypothetical protein